jgi:hypothetical protein
MNIITENSMKKYDDKFIIALCQYHGLNLGYLYSDRDVIMEILKFEALYKVTLLTHREEIARLTIMKVCLNLEISPEEFDNPLMRYGDIGLSRQLVCYILDKFGYTNKQIAKTLNFSEPRVSESKKTARERLRDHHIRVAMTMIFTEVFEQIFTNPLKHEKSNYSDIPSDVNPGIRPGSENAVSPKKYPGKAV